MSETHKVQEKAREHFEAAYESISELVQTLESQYVFEVEEAQIRIGESARRAERIVGYKILLACGGPEYWLAGELDGVWGPETVRFYYRDWFTRPVQVELSPSETETLLEYARQFYFGE